MTARNLGFSKKLNLIRPDAQDPPKIFDQKTENDEGRSLRRVETVDKIGPRKETGPFASLYLLLPLTSYNRFASWAIENQLNYCEALEDLLDRANVE